MVDFPWMLLGARFGLDPIGKVFLAFTAFVWLISGLYALAYIKKSRSFTFFFLLSMAGNFGLIVAQDLISFYFFFALMSFSAYGLVVHSATKEAFFAGKIYIILAIFGELLLFAGMALAVSESQSLLFSDLNPSMGAQLLLFFGFGVKVGVIFLHVWLPLAHPVAPTPASAVLSACMIKAGLLGWLRVLPLGTLEAAEWGIAVQALGILAAVYAVIVGLTQDDPKVVLAYSSVSQMGVMTIAVGVGLQFPERWESCLAALLLYVTVHALVKGALFLGVGLPTKGALFTAAQLLPILAMMGAPLTAGAFSKELYKYATEQEALLFVTSLATTLLMVRFALLLFGSSQKSSATPGIILPWLALVLTVALLPLFLLGSESFHPWNLWQYLPTACGLLIASGALLFNVQKPFKIPVGDLLALYVKAASLLSLPKIDVRLPTFTPWEIDLNPFEKKLKELPLYGALFLAGTLLIALIQYGVLF